MKDEKGNMVDIPLFIFKRRKELGLTLKELEDKSGYPVKTIRNLESGRVKDPKLYIVEDILNTIGLEITISEAKK